MIEMDGGEGDDTFRVENLDVGLPDVMVRHVRLRDDQGNNHVWVNGIDETATTTATFDGEVYYFTADDNPPDGAGYYWHVPTLWYKLS